MTIPL